VLLPGAAHAIRALNEAGLRVIVVTNQRGVARGALTERDLQLVHRRLRELLWEEAGATLSAIHHCPHEAGTCECRKPGVGLLLAAREDWPEIEFSHSALIGDSLSDVLAGERLGMETVLLGRDAADLAAAVADLLGVRRAIAANAADAGRPIRSGR
jgi:D-glycero-D-manno-heptose 1,7-bisphosphate phosphatase